MPQVRLGMEILPKTWIAGTPRTWGIRRIEEEWLSIMRNALRKFVPDEFQVAHRYEVTVEFLIWPGSPKYGGQLREHGPDLDNLVKLTIDGLTPLRGRGLGIIPDDTAIYRISASKVLVTSDSETGAWLTVTAE